MRFSASLFKAYDLHGVVPSMLDEPVAEAVGRAFAAMATREGERTVATGRDGRISGPSLAGALVRGLVAGGIDVIDVGMVTTPMLYFAASTLTRSGIQVTASHNPKDDNGFKLVLAGRTVHGGEIQELRRIMEAAQWREASKPGTVRRADVFAAYLDRITSGIRLARPMKIALDCGNGVGGASAPQVFRALGCEVIELFSDVDGTFPNHHPDPGKPENLADLVACMRAAPNWAWHWTATATASASSRPAARSSTRTGR